MSHNYLGGPDGHPIVTALPGERLPGPRPGRIAGAVLAVCGVLMIVFSTLAWATDTTDFEFVGFPATAVTTVSGLGEVSVDVVIDQSAVPEEFHSQFADIERQSETQTVAVMEGHTSALGGWTIAFGAVLILAAIPLLFARFTAIGAVVGGAAASAGIVTAGIVAAAPAQRLLEIDALLATDPSSGGTTLADFAGYTAGYGLWVVLAAAVPALLAAFSVLFDIAGEPHPPARTRTDRD